MMWKLLGIAIIAHQILTPTFGANLSLLESEAHAINTKLSSHQHVSPSEIRETFHFIYDETSISEMYKQPTKFRALYDQATSEAEGAFSKAFVENCREIYEEESNPKLKASVHLLLEKVREEYLKSLKRIKKHEIDREEEATKARVISHADRDAFSRFFGVDMAAIALH